MTNTPVIFLILLGLSCLSEVELLVSLRAPERRPLLLATVVLSLWGLAALGGLVGLGVVRLSERMRADLLPPAVALFTLLSAGALLVGGVALLRPVRSLFAWLPRSLAYALSALLTLPLLGAALYGPISTLGKNYSPRLLVVVAAAFTMLIGRRLLARRARATWIGLAHIGLALLLGAVGLRLYSDHPGVRVQLDDAQGPTKYLARALRILGDGDGDGFAPWLGGRDCDDDDPTIHPMGIDIPGNGLDEDCYGGDRDAIQPRERGLSTHYARTPALSKRWNFLLITIDALRADHLSTFGYERETSPNISKLAEHGLAFERAYPAANSTRFSLPTLFAGRRLGDMWADRTGRILELLQGNKMLSERLQRGGWYTEAHLLSEFRNGWWLGLGAGFDHFVGHPKTRFQGRSAYTLTKAVSDSLNMMQLRSEPWMIWVHYMEPHMPYRRHRTHDFGSAPIDRYDSEIARVDASVGRLTKRLAELKLADCTVVVITSDHGEEFYEHGQKFHGKTFFEESIRVPLIIHIPGQPAHRISSPVSVTDIPETLANLAGLPPGEEFGARSHVGLLTGELKVPAQRSLYVEKSAFRPIPFAEAFAWIEWPNKISIDLITGHERLYNLEQDPEERDNLRESQPEIYKRMSLGLRTEVERLKALNYHRTRGRRVFRQLPIRLRTKPQLVAPGLEWLGATITSPPKTDDMVRKVHNWFRAVGPVRDDLFIRIDIFGRGGIRLRRHQARPLGGMLPTHRLAGGEVFEELTAFRFNEQGKQIAFKMSVLKNDELIFGPKSLGVEKIGRF